MALTAEKFDKKLSGAVAKASEEKMLFNSIISFLITLQMIEKYATSPDVQKEVHVLKEDFFKLLTSLVEYLPRLASDAMVFLQNTKLMIEDPSEKELCVAEIKKLSLNEKSADDIERYCNIFNSKLEPLTRILSRYMGSSTMKEIKEEMEKIYEEILIAQKILDELFQVMVEALGEAEVAKFRFELHECKKQNEIAFKARLQQELDRVGVELIQAGKDVVAHRNTRCEQRRRFWFIKISSTSQFNDNGEGPCRERENNLRQRQAELTSMIQSNSGVDDHLSATKELVATSQARYEVAKKKWETANENMNALKEKSKGLAKKLDDMMKQTDAKTHEEVVQMQNLSELATRLRISILSASKELSETLQTFRGDTRFLANYIYPAFKILILNQSLGIVLQRFGDEFDAALEDKIYESSVKSIENDVKEL